MSDVSPASQFITLQQTLAMHRGGRLEQVKLAYETWGTLNAERSNVILLLTGLSPGAHACSSKADPKPGWWESMIGPGKALDTERWFVICINSLGSCKGSTGPASCQPGSDRPWRMRFPALSLQDIANSSRLALKQLGIDRVDTVIGPSMGGMTALALVLDHPGFARRMINISSAPRALPFAIAIRSLQREAILADPDFAGGDYPEQRPPINGMRFARKLGVVSYRSDEEWRQRFGRIRISEERREHAPFAREFEVESYLEAHAQRFAGHFDPVSYIYLSRAMDWFDVNDYGTDIPEVLASSQLKQALVIGVDSDLLFTVDQQEELAIGLKSAGIETDFHGLPSLQGHDSFLVDVERFDPPIRKFLND